MKITIKTGKRGRGLSIDTDRLIDDIIELYKSASRGLANLRKTTKGYRSPELLGTSTTAPDWVTEALDIAYMAEQGRVPSVGEIKEIRKVLADLKRLSSPYEKVQYRALGERIGAEYEQSLDMLIETATSGKVRREARQLKKKLAKLSASEKTKIFTSRKYQDIRFRVGRYERVKKWSERETGKKMTYQEAMDYLAIRRIEDGLEIYF